MKRTLYACLAAIVILSGTGCTCFQPFQRVANLIGGRGDCEHEEVVAASGPQMGPQMGSVTYPYYTTRGPRDFLAGQPRGIGR